ncbi:Uncharacterised protein [Klebsiella pneumoniae]|nr:Uncharacterised protein [Klebsiella pneumoniae]
MADTVGVAAYRGAKKCGLASIVFQLCAAQQRSAQAAIGQRHLGAEQRRAPVRHGDGHPRLIAQGHLLPWLTVRGQRGGLR